MGFIPRLSRLRTSAVHGCLWAMAGSATLWNTAGCDAPTPVPPGTCTSAVWAVASHSNAKLSVIGDWDGWQSSTTMVPYAEAPWWVGEIVVPPGEYGYLVVEDGRGRTDPYNGLGGFREGDELEVSWLVVPDCLEPRLLLDSTAGEPPRFSVIPSRFGDALDRADWTLTIDGKPAPLARLAHHGDQVTVHAPPLPRGRHRLELAATRPDRPPVRGQSLVWSEPIAERLDDGIIYQILIDRFRADGGQHLLPPDQLGGRAGGTLGGIEAEIETGRFEKLGVSTLWLSPVYLNPEGLRPGRDEAHPIGGYHGYWPVDSRTIDPRIGGAAALHRVVAAAHARGIGVMLDLVPNHYDQTNPRVVAHGGDGWFNRRDPLCICGAPDCPWATHIETCWFAPYLPDIRLQQPDALAAAIADARWLHETFDTDGFRIDAVPMMPRAATRRIIRAVRDSIGPRSAVTMLGEIFTGPGTAGIAEIRYHIGPDGLDSAFDFPSMWAIRQVVRSGQGFDRLATVLAQESREFAGSQVVMARILGNHDTTRIASWVAGDDAADPWEDPPKAVTDPQVFARLKVAFALLMTLPGAPVIYYGDEVALAGGHDPDSRRVMPAPAALTAAQQDLQVFVEALGTLRRCSLALRRGDMGVLLATADDFIFTRMVPGRPPIIVLLSRRSDAGELALRSDPQVPPGWYKDAVSGESFELREAGRSLAMAPFGVRILVPQELDCD